jgi:hypothetical protein
VLLVAVISNFRQHNNTVKVCVFHYGVYGTVTYMIAISQNFPIFVNL